MTIVIPEMFAALDDYFLEHAIGDKVDFINSVIA